MHVLLVDDNKIFVEQLQKYPSQQGLAVDTATGGAEGLEKMQRQPYDVVVLDLKMPDIPGTEVLRRARDRAITSRFIILTGYGDVQSAVETMKLGAIDFLEKPFEGNALLECINNAAERRPRPPYWLPLKIMARELQKQCAGKPVLAVTEVHPRLFRERLGVTALRAIWLKDPALQEMLSSPGYLLDQVEEFVAQQEGAVVIQYGMGLLQERCGEECFSQHMDRLHQMADRGRCRLFLVFRPEDEEHLMEGLGEVALYPAIEDMLTVLHHQVRCTVIQLLRTGGLRYRDLLDRVNVNHSADLSHHLKILRQHGVIEKKERRYTLTAVGHRYVDILQYLLAMSALQQDCPVVYVPLL
ncbi:MAG TPA: response regulator [Thermoplasmatales archaeon]|nr:response regulator [Thermoplasmatales archaeon]